MVTNNRGRMEDVSDTRKDTSDLSSCDNPDGDSRRFTHDNPNLSGDTHVKTDVSRDFEANSTSKVAKRNMKSTKKKGPKRKPGRPPGSLNRSTIARMKAEEEAIALFMSSDPDAPPFRSTGVSLGDPKHGISKHEVHDPVSTTSTTNVIHGPLRRDLQSNHLCSQPQHPSPQQPPHHQFHYFSQPYHQPPQVQMPQNNTSTSELHRAPIVPLPRVTNQFQYTENVDPSSEAASFYQTLPPQGMVFDPSASAIVPVYYQQPIAPLNHPQSVHQSFQDQKQPEYTLPFIRNGPTEHQVQEQNTNESFPSKQMPRNSTFGSNHSSSLYAPDRQLYGVPLNRIAPAVYSSSQLPYYHHQSQPQPQAQLQPQPSQMAISPILQQRRKTLLQQDDASNELSGIKNSGNDKIEKAEYENQRNEDATRDTKLKSYTQRLEFENNSKNTDNSEGERKLSVNSTLGQPTTASYQPLTYQTSLPSVQPLVKLHNPTRPTRTATSSSFSSGSTNSINTYQQTGYSQPSPPHSNIAQYKPRSGSGLEAGFLKYQHQNPPSQLGTTTPSQPYFASQLAATHQNQQPFTAFAHRTRISGSLPSPYVVFPGPQSHENTAINPENGSSILPGESSTTNDHLEPKNSANEANINESKHDIENGSNYERVDRTWNG